MSESYITLADQFVVSDDSSSSRVVTVAVIVNSDGAVETVGSSVVALGSLSVGGSIENVNRVNQRTEHTVG